MGRRKGTTAFPVARIKKMMQSDDDVGKIATATPVLVAKALECMMEDVLRDAAAVALARRTKTVTPQHLKHSVTHNVQFDFLRAILNAVPTLDDPNAPPVRRAKRPRAQILTSAAPASAFPGEGRVNPVGRPKRPRAPRPVRKEEDDDDGETMSAHAVPSPTLQPPAVTPPATQKHEDDEDDYDECDDGDDIMDSTESQKPTSMQTETQTETTEPLTPQYPVQPLILKEQPGLDAPRQPDTPVVIRDFGIQPQITTDDGDKPKVKAAERVSVHALLS